MVVYPIIYRVWDTSQVVVWDFSHQQYQPFVGNFCSNGKVCLLLSLYSQVMEAQQRHLGLGEDFVRGVHTVDWFRIPKANHRLDVSPNPGKYY